MGDLGQAWVVHRHKQTPETPKKELAPPPPLPHMLELLLLVRLLLSK